LSALSANLKFAVYAYDALCGTNTFLSHYVVIFCTIAQGELTYVLEM